MAKSKSLLKVTVLKPNAKPENKFVQQVTEKIVVICDTPNSMVYMRRDTGFPYSAKDKADEVGIVARASLDKVEEFMKLANKPKWHSGWKPAEGTFDGYEVIDMSSSEEEIVEAERKQQGLRKISKEEADRLRAEKIKPIGAQIYDEGDFDNDTAPIPAKEKHLHESDLPADEFDDGPEDFSTTEKDDFDDDFDEVPQLLGGDIDEKF